MRLYNSSQNIIFLSEIVQYDQLLLLSHQSFEAGMIPPVTAPDTLGYL